MWGRMEGEAEIQAGRRKMVQDTEYCAAKSGLFLLFMGGST